MAEQLAISIDDGKIEQKLNKLALKAGVTVGFICEDQMRLWVNDIMRKSQPKTLSEGRARIKADVQRIFTPIDDPGVLKAWKEQALKEAGDVFTRIKRGTMRVSQKQLSVDSLAKMRAIHKFNRTKKGGIKKNPTIRAWGGEGLVPKALFNKFLKEQQARVGLLKSRFGAAALYYAGRTRGKTPAYANWIRRHIPGGSATGRIDRYGNGSISSINDARYAAKQMLGKGWWKITQLKRQKDIISGGFKRMADLTARFNAGAM